MSGFKGKFSAIRTDWETPADLFQPLHDEFGFTLDCAASAVNAKVARYFTEEQDALSLSWGREVCWVNPPYSNVGAWVKKAFDAACEGATIVMLLPARTNTNWFHDICVPNAEIRFVRGRPKFSGGSQGLPQPLCLAIFRPQ